MPWHAGTYFGHGRLCTKNRHSCPTPTLPTEGGGRGHKLQCLAIAWHTTTWLVRSATVLIQTRTQEVAATEIASGHTRSWGSVPVLDGWREWCMHRLGGGGATCPPMPAGWCWQRSSVWCRGHWPACPRPAGSRMSSGTATGWHLAAGVGDVAGRVKKN